MIDWGYRWGYQFKDTPRYAVHTKGQIRQTGSARLYARRQRWAVNGSKLWRYKFRVHGTEGLQALGAFPEIDLAEARGLHTDARKLVAQSINPIQARRDEKIVQAQVQLERVNGAFAAVMADWSAATAADLRPSTVRQRKREIDNDLLPKLKSHRG